MANGRLQGQREPQRQQIQSPTEDFQANPSDDVTDDGYVEQDTFSNNDVDDADFDVDDIDSLFSDEEGDDLDALFDDEEPNDEQQPTDMFERFLEFVDGRANAPETQEQDDTSFETYFDGIYGDGLDFSSMFEDADVDAEQITSINENLNGQFKKLMAENTRKTMSTVMTMVQANIKETMQAAETERTAAQVKSTLRSKIVKNMPFVAQRENAALFNEVYERAYENAKGDPKKTVDYIRKLYQKTNPNLFRNNKNTSFARPRKSQTPKPAGKSAWGNWLNG